MQIFRGRSEDWGDAPARLNMTVEEGRLRGTWKGAIELIGLHTWETREYRDDGGRWQETTDYYTSFSARLDPPLMMGLSVTDRALIGRMKDALLGQKDLQVGEAELDRCFEIAGLEPEHVRAVLTGEPATELLRGRWANPSLTVTDTGVWVRREEWERDVDRISKSFEAAGRIAAALLERRALALASWEPALRAGWAPVAQAWGLDFDPRRAEISGMVRGALLEATNGSTGARTVVRVELAEYLGCSLSLTRQGEKDGFFARLFRGQDLETGDPAFDGAFQVKGEPPERVLSLLGPVARARLLEVLSWASAMTLKENKLEVWAAWRVIESEQLDQMLKLAFSAAEALTPRVALPGRGPFRQ